MTPTGRKGITLTNAGWQSEEKHSSCRLWTHSMMC